jgi:hypothetical protein
VILNSLYHKGEILEKKFILIKLGTNVAAKISLKYSDKSPLWLILVFKIFLATSIDKEYFGYRIQKTCEKTLGSINAASLMNSVILTLVVGPWRTMLIKWYIRLNASINNGQHA